MHIAICAGEPSGDALGADLIGALKNLYPDATFSGIAGPRMQSQGCQSLFPMETLSVMGVGEVLPKLPAILSIRRKLIQHFNQNLPDLFIGIDSPDFMLTVEKAMKKRGVKTVHYVSPTVWAWREKRVLTIKKSIDLMLCVFPFETKVYEKYGVDAVFVGHPAAERLKLTLPRDELRDSLGFSKSSPVLAILPGSRSMEIKYLGLLFLNVANVLAQKYPDIEFLIPAVNEKIRDELEKIYETLDFSLKIRVTIGCSDEVMRVADVVLCTSGTTTLEAMLLNKPMVVAYKMSAFNWWLAQHLVHVKYIALPNLLADKAIVPEFVQEDANIHNLTQALEAWFDRSDRAAYCETLYQPYCTALAQNASQRAAEAIKALMHKNTAS